MTRTTRIQVWQVQAEPPAEPSIITTEPSRKDALQAATTHALASAHECSIRTVYAIRAPGRPERFETVPFSLEARVSAQGEATWRVPGQMPEPTTPEYGAYLMADPGAVALRIQAGWDPDPRMGSQGPPLRFVGTPEWRTLNFAATEFLTRLDGPLEPAAALHLMQALQEWLRLAGRRAEATALAARAHTSEAR